jgi:DNA repair protein RadC
MQIYTNKIPMRKWAEDDLPDQKMLLKGANSLSNAELLAIIIGTGIKDNSSIEIAKQMLSSYDNNFN